MNKLSPSLIGFLGSVLIAIICYVVYQSFFRVKDISIIDNPSSNKIELVLNKKKLISNPESQIQFKPEQENKLIIKELNIDTIFKPKSYQILINPSRTAYLIYERFYGNSSNPDSILSANKFVLDGETYLGKCKLDSSLIIEGFDYNLHQELPRLIRRNKDTIKSYKKVFKIKEFKQFYYTHYK